ncbi:MAG: putative nucleic acid-binding protein [Gammaproteobacteria bacterium]
MFLLDTDVVSELRKAGTSGADENLTRWAGSVESGYLYLSSISILELEIGVLRMERRDKRQGSGPQIVAGKSRPAGF